MALDVFHPCQFNFDGFDLRRVGNVIDGGTSLSGYQDLTDGETLCIDDGLEWEALTDGMDGGATPVIVLLCSHRAFQPINDRVSLGPPNAVIADDAPDKGAEYVAAVAASLRATTLVLSGNSERPLKRGMLFAIQHTTWEWHVYRIRSVSGSTVTFRPPLREAIDANTPVEFDTPRCRMKLAQATSNPTSQGIYVSCAASFVEDMRKPS
jgi:hypothetical protein